MQRFLEFCRQRAKPIALAAGAVLCVGVLAFGNLDPGKPQVTRTAAVALLMAVWWLSEALPLAVTALVPMILFPTLGVMSGRAVAREYFSETIFLFVGGFIVALAMERWNLHKRMALRILLMFGTQPRRILLGFMVATAFVSMWISNTATAMMMVTIVLAVILKLEDHLGRETIAPLAVALLLSVAYSSSIGGIATLVGTPTNLSLRTIFADSFPKAPPVAFLTWMAFGTPLAAVMLLAAWRVLCYLHLPRDYQPTIPSELLREEYDKLGPMSFAEKVVLTDFAALVALWITRADVPLGGLTIPGWANLFGRPDNSPLDYNVEDGVVAIAAAFVLFLIPNRPGSATKVMDWPTAVRLPWDVVLLFGGGFALAAAFAQSGLSEWIGERLKAAAWLDELALLGLICLVIMFLTELTSNTATANMILPVMAALAVSIQLNPLFLMVPVTITCSLGFVMPAGTPPNAIVFGTGRLRMAEMAKAGLVLNLIGVVLVAVGMWVLGRFVWGIDLGQLPDWAVKPGK